jgi:hypothetical protein
LEEQHAFFGNTLAMCFRRENSPTVTVIWDFVQNEWASWWTDCELHDVGTFGFRCIVPLATDPLTGLFPFQICLKEGLLFYIHRGGLHARELPPLSPVIDQTIYIPVYGNEDTDPSYMWRYKKQIDIAEGHGLFDAEVDPDTFNPSKLDGRPLVYEIMEYPKLDNTIRLRRYHLSSYAKLAESAEPKLKLVEVCRLRKPHEDGAHNLVPTIRRTCEGRLATFWIDDTTYPPTNFLSITPPSDYRSICPGSATLKTTFSLVKITSETSNSTELDPYLNMYHFCAASGIIVTLRNDLDESDTPIRLDRFL